ncbi:TfoX/Sxy family DNA transformation protein [Pseudothioclava arenosa]|uniref:Competence protein TfoX n=1 Tax=Pseudothioclava arenosa TaxID=1795308 RepID=A0A2A4CNC2_9RHOB|nr:TfoX/Sxy family DNA transformation protein [Pseudothioclava arenosa]PCD75778.1 competence protein TfoX [Pseudothioclava arenosa]
MRPLTDIRGIGPATAERLLAAGIPDAEALHALGAEAAYERLLASGDRPHFIAFYALVMALQGRPWNDCKGAEKAALRVRFDALCARATPGPEMEKGRLPMEAALDALGLRRG